MSQSTCIKCGNPVSMYEKYCQACVDTHHLRQNPVFHKFHSEWDLEAELRADTIEMPEDAPEAEPEPVAASKTLIKKPKPQPTGRHGRVPCLGGCGAMVIPSLGECRKCRKARLREGKKHVLRLRKVEA